MSKIVALANISLLLILNACVPHTEEKTDSYVAHLDEDFPDDPGGGGGGGWDPGDGGGWEPGDDGGGSDDGGGDSDDDGGDGGGNGGGEYGGPNNGATTPNDPNGKVVSEENRMVRSYVFVDNNLDVRTTTVAWSAGQQKADAGQLSQGQTFAVTNSAGTAYWVWAGPGAVVRCANCY